MDQPYIKSEDINFFYKRAIKILIALLFTFTTLVTKSQDSSFTKVNIIVGLKFFNSNAAPEIRTASNIGIDYYPFKHKNIIISFRNFFNVFLTPRDSTFPKAVRLLETSNSVIFNYQKNFNKSFIRFGVGPYTGRDQSFIDQVFILSDRTEYGVEISVYSKLQWINIGFRHQSSLITNKLFIGRTLDLNRFAVCIEIPIKLK